jgi:hypothetical protein
VLIGGVVLGIVVPVRMELWDLRVWAGTGDGGVKSDFGHWTGIWRWSMFFFSCYTIYIFNKSMKQAISFLFMQTTLPN